MSLPDPAAREKLHRREILIEGFARDDGNFDIDAVLTAEERTQLGSLQYPATESELAGS